MKTNTNWQALLAASRTRTAAHRAAHDQLIRDARAAGVSIVDIAAAVGTTDRGVVYRALEREPELLMTGHTLNVYLRGAAVDAPTWSRVADAMIARGWMTESNRTAAWHLCRGGVPTVLCDFSANLNRGEGRFVAVWLVRAVLRGEAMELERTLGGNFPAPFRQTSPADIPPALAGQGDILDEQALVALVANVMSLRKTSIGDVCDDCSRPFFLAQAFDSRLMRMDVNPVEDGTWGLLPGPGYPLAVMAPPGETVELPDGVVDADGPRYRRHQDACGTSR